jgi:hydroxymethylpyrimidine/phosphomethylpyrimidine kinase
MVFASLGCFGTACATALTIQSTLGVRRWEAVSDEVVRDTLACLEGDLPANGIKIGMLATAENVLAVCEFVANVRRRKPDVAVVLDPVLRSSSGRELLSAAGVAMLQERLMPLVDWITPNMAELGELAGIRVEAQVEMERAARLLHQRYQTLGVVAKGGHLEGRADDLVLEQSGRATWLRGPRLASRATHGTGCAFSSAMACGLARGEEAVEAAGKAKEYVRGAMERATPIGAGNGPMNLLWPLRK